jgi:dTDP-glucose 4,6-dehydratase
LVLSLLSEKIGNNGFEELISHVLDRPGHDLRYSIDSSKIDSVIGTEWKNGTNFKENLKITINWYIENPNWWND